MNKKLVQGKWKLISARQSFSDSIIDYSKTQTYLSFQSDTCTELMPDLHDKSAYRFDIKDYELELYVKDSQLVSQLEIKALNKDSIVLETDKGLYRKYKREKEE